MLWQTQRCSSLFLQKTVFLQRRSLFGKGLNRSEKGKGRQETGNERAGQRTEYQRNRKKTEKLLAKLGIFTVGDFLRYYPRDYDEYREPIAVSEAEPGKKAAVFGRITGRVGMSNTGRKTVVTATIKDEKSSLQLIWYNMPFLRNTLQAGGFYTFRGTVVKKGGAIDYGTPGNF